MTREQVTKHNARVATALCKQHECNDRQRKLHFEMIVHRAWNPHPSAEFVEWWHSQPEFRDRGVDAVRARNCKIFCDRFKEAVEIGAASMPMDHPAIRR